MTAQRYHDAYGDADLIDGQSIRRVIDGWPILLCRSDGVVFAVIDRCSHVGVSLKGGEIRRNIVTCPLHRGRFDLTSGRCIGSHYPPLGTFAIRIDNGRIEILIPGNKPLIPASPESDV